MAAGVRLARPLLLLLLAWSVHASLVVCTVGSNGNDYSTLQSALLGCNGGAGDIKLDVDAGPNSTLAAFTEVLSFPLALTTVVIRPLVANTRISIIGAGHYVDPTSWLALCFVNVTFDGGNSLAMLFEPGLTNTNLTCEFCYFVNFNGPRVLWGEPCEDSTQWRLTDCQWGDVQGSAIHIDPAETIQFERNTCRRCKGLSDVDFGAVHWFGIHAISHGAFIWNSNAGWALFDAQPQRCRYYLDAQADTRCSQVDTDLLGQPVMQLQCYDELTTLDLDFCTVGDAIILDPFGLGVQVNVMADFLPYCRTYAPCQCNNVLFSQTVNGTTSTVTLGLGNVIYQVPASPDLVLDCIPSSGVNALNGTYTCSEVFNGYTSQDITCAEGFTSGVLAASGSIPSNCTCPANRTRSLADIRDPAEFPCRYSLEDGLLCEEGTMYCCAEPYWSYDDARYYLESCGEQAQSDGTVSLSLYKDFGQFYALGNPAYNDTHFSLQMWAKLNGVLQTPLMPLTYYSNAVSHVIAVSGMGTVTASAVNILGTPVGDELVLAVNFFGELVTVAAHGIQVNSTWYYYRLDTSARDMGASQYLPMDGSTSTECTLFELLALTLDTFVTDPTQKYTSSVTIEYGPTEYEVDIVDTLDNSDQSGNTLFFLIYVNSTLCANITGTVNTLVATLPNGVCAGLDTSTFTATRSGVAFVTDTREVDYSIQFTNDPDNPLAHTWRYTAQLLSFNQDQIFFSTAMGLFSDAFSGHYPQSIFNAHATYFVDVVRVPRFFEPVFFSDEGCGASYDDPSCLVMSDCATLFANGSAVGCVLLNCSAQYAALNESNVHTPPTLAFLATCVVVDSNSTVAITYTLPCVYRSDDFSFNDSFADDVSMAHLVRVEGAGVCLPMSYHKEPVNPMDTCPSGLYVDCSCAGLTGNASLPQNATDSYWPNSNYTCLGGVTTCPCDDSIFGVLYPPQNDSTMFYISHLPDTLSVVQMIDNRAQQLAYALFMDQVSYELLARFSIVLPPFRDVQGSPRITALQDNEFLWGVVHDVVQWPRWLPPPRFADDPLDLSCQVWCDNVCPQELVDPADYVCIVDKEVTPDTPGYGVYIFENISSAIDYSANHGDGCRTTHKHSAANKTIQVRFSEQYYDETIDVTSDVQNLYLISFDQALVSGSDHQLDGRVHLFQIRGLVFMHAEENKKALFSVVNRNLAQYNSLNCEFIGGSVHSGGTIEGRAVSSMVFQYNLWDDWEVYAARLLNVDTVVFQGNTIANSVGRSLYIEFNQWVQVTDTVLYETRGGSDFKEAAIITLRARNSQACQEFTDDGTGTFLAPDKRKNCTLRHNIQHVDFFSDDYRDQCFWIDRGNWNVWRMSKNKCLKAEYGITLSNLDQWQSFGSQSASDVLGGTLEWFSIYNPLVRPTLFRLASSAKFVGWDYRLRGASAQTPLGQDLSGLLAVFRSANKDTRNFNDLDKNLKPRMMPSDYRFEIVQVWFANNGTALQCEVNNNYEDCSMRFDFGPPLAQWGFDRVYPVHGFYQYHNVSLAASFCADANVLQGLDPYIFVTSWNASRIRLDNITVTRDMWILGDTSNPWTWCTIERNYPPVIAGHGHEVATRFLNMTWLEFWLDFSEDSMQTEIWHTFNVPQKGMVWDHVIIDGRGLVPNSNTRVAYIECGEALPAPDGKKGGVKNTKPVPPSECLIELYDMTVRNFYAFKEETLVDSSTGAVQVVDSFPYTDGFRIKCVNSLNSLSQVIVQNSTFENLDREGLEIIDCLRTYVMDTLFANCSGRSRGNFGCLYIDGNADNNTVNASVLLVRNVTIYQDKPELFKTNSRPVNPNHVSAFYISGYANETLFCFFDNNAWGLEVGVRFVEMNRTILQSCLHPNETYFFPDRSRELRAICRYGNNFNVTGRWHDFMWDGPGSQDRYRNNEWCDNMCCELIDPTICYVDKVPELLVPENPWYQKFLFGTICDAIEGCQARDRFIAVVGQQNTFGWFPDDLTDEAGKSNNRNFVPFKFYNETIDCVAGPRMLLRQVFNSTTNTTMNVTVIDYSNIVVSASTGHEVCASGHRIDSQQGVRIRLMGLNFTQCGGLSPTWDQPPSYNSTGMVLEGNLFDGQGVGLTPVNGVFDTGFTMRDNFLFDYVGPLGSIINGRDCTNTLLTLQGNVFHNMPGGVCVVQNTQSLDFSGNLARESGGQVYPPLYVFYLSVCDATTGGVERVHHNRVRLQQQTIVPPSDQHVAAFYFDGVYVATKSTRIEDNIVTALFDIGGRFDNMPGASRSLLRDFALNYQDIAMQGTWHDLVWGPPSIDSSIDADPAGLSNHFCDDGCAGNDISPLGYVVGAVLVLLLLGVCGYLLCCASKRSGTNTFYSQFLGTEVSTNTHEWRELTRGVASQRPDPRFSHNQLVPATDAVNPEIQFYQQQADAAQGYVPTNAAW